MAFADSEGNHDETIVIRRPQTRIHYRRCLRLRRRRRRRRFRVYSSSKPQPLSVDRRRRPLHPFVVAADCPQHN